MQRLAEVTLTRPWHWGVAVLGDPLAEVPSSSLSGQAVVIGDGVVAIGVRHAQDIDAERFEGDWDWATATFPVRSLGQEEPVVGPASVTLSSPRPTRRSPSVMPTAWWSFLRRASGLVSSSRPMKSTSPGWSECGSTSLPLTADEEHPFPGAAEAGIRGAIRRGSLGEMFTGASRRSEAARLSAACRRGCEGEPAVAYEAPCGS